MKLYTEEQVRFIIQEAREVDWWEQKFDFSVEDITSQLKPIELPSDEEILEYTTSNSYDAFYEEGLEKYAKWIKEQILNQNK